MDIKSKKKMIQFEGVNKSFSNTEALKNLSFSILENEFVGLVGNNGCGKTTSINALCNIVSQDSGNIFVFGSKITPYNSSYKNRIGIILDSPYFIEEFTIEEYLLFVGKFQLIKKIELKNRIKNLLGVFELDRHKNKSIKKLSSGNQMKVTVAASLIHNPEILVLDEPFINLDINTTNTVMSILKSFKGKKTIVITSHNLDLIVELCDKFLIMDNGKIINEFQKKQFDSIEDLKESVKNVLVQDKTIPDLSWLN